MAATARLSPRGTIRPPCGIGTVGDALDNALKESTIGFDKSELLEHDRAEAGAAPRSSNETSIGKMSTIEFEVLYELAKLTSADVALA